MKEVLCGATVITGSAQLTDQFSVDENTNEVVFTFAYTKGTEAGVNISIQRADNADGVWSTISDLSEIGTNPLVPLVLQITSTDTRAYSLPIVAHGFYRVSFVSGGGAATGTLAVSVVKDK